MAEAGSLHRQIWQVESAQIQYKLPGHKGTVVACEFSPTDNAIMSTGVDGQIFLGESAFAPFALSTQLIGFAHSRTPA